MRLAVLLALTSTAYAEPKDGGWTFDAAVGAGERVAEVSSPTIAPRVAALSLGFGHVFVPDVSSELRFDEIVLRDGSSIVGALAITVGCRFWVSPNGYATLGFGRAIPQYAGLTDFNDGGYAFAGGVGYAMAVTGGAKLTVGVGVTHISDRNAPTTVSALIGVLAL